MVIWDGFWAGGLGVFLVWSGLVWVVSMDPYRFD